MTCAPCKVMMLQVAKLLESLSGQELPEPLRSEIRQVKYLLVLTGYHIGSREIDEMPSGRSTYKDVV